VFYILVGVFGVTLAAVFMAFPPAFITTLAGWPCWAPSAPAWPAPWRTSVHGKPALITFLACAANINLLGIGGAFWGLLIGLAAYALLNGRLPRRRGRAPVYR
jgi:benzoate membrane transport protein